MQQPAHTPAHAQHIPPGWNFPTLNVAASAQQQAPAPVVGGGGTATVTRLRWGRLLPLLAGVVLIAFGLWSVTRDASSTPPSNRSVEGGGTADDVDIARSARTDLGTSERAENGETSERAASTPATSPPATTPGTAPANANRGSRPARRPVRRAAGAAAVARATPAAAAATSPRTVGGGGTSGELPLTGIETWIAGILGAMLLLIGICVHVNAVRLAATAMLYRRGILLRPVDCARMAQRRGVPQVRVMLSNVLHRLLEEPARGDFVGTRLAR